MSSERHGTEVPSTPSGRGEIPRSAEALHHGQVHFGAGPPEAGRPLTHPFRGAESVCCLEVYITMVNGV